jgi:phytoene dehydrogenase-like protein
MTAAWHLTYHMAGMSHPRGGAGALTQAMLQMISAHGGEVHTNNRVDQIISRGKQVTGIRLHDGETVSAGKIVSAIHIQTTLGLLGESAGSARRKIDRLDLGNGSGMAVRLAVGELPNYAARPGAAGPQHIAVQWIGPDPDYARRAYADFRAGKVSANPLLAAMTFSAADATLAPRGKHTLFLWGQYFPYRLADGQHWDDLREQAAAQLLDKLVEYAPNMRSAVIDQYIETPLDLERLFGMRRANITHLPMDVQHMFMLRPALEFSQYRGPLNGLYLSGASTHPGGGITGQPGRNAARVILKDFVRER